MKITVKKRLKIHIKERKAAALYQALDAAIKDDILSNEQDTALKKLRDSISEQLSS